MNNQVIEPSPYLMAYALQAMCAGKAVLCEKPVGISLSQAEQLEQCAKENGVYFAEAMWTWFCDTALKVKEWVQSGKIGQVQKIEIFHAFPGLMKPKTSRVLNPETAGGTLWNTARITAASRAQGNSFRCRASVRKPIWKFRIMCA